MGTGSSTQWDLVGQRGRAAQWSLVVSRRKSTAGWGLVLAGKRALPDEAWFRCINSFRMYVPLCMCFPCEYPSFVTPEVFILHVCHSVCVPSCVCFFVCILPLCIPQCVCVFFLRMRVCAYFPFVCAFLMCVLFVCLRNILFLSL